MRYITLSIIMPLVVSCGNKQETYIGVNAQMTADKVRDEWVKSRRGLEIRISNEERFSDILPAIGVWGKLHDATEDEIGKFAGISFIRKGSGYLSSDRDALTADTLFSVYTCFPYRQGAGTDKPVAMYAPYTENLYGVETGRRIGNNVIVEIDMKSSMALLRINIERDNVHDILENLRIYGECIYSSGEYMPYTGVWSAQKTDGTIESNDAGCLLNNGQWHDFYLIPTVKSGDVTVLATITGHEYSLKTTLPPMDSGSLTQLNLRKKGKNEFGIAGSWVETERKLTTLVKVRPDTIRAGYFIQQDGSINIERDSLSIAVVIDSDGKHGKAVSLKDCPGMYCFSKIAVSSGIVFKTIDGERTEGIINPPHLEDVADGLRILYTESMPYGKEVALGGKDGAELTDRIIHKAARFSDISETEMISTVRKRKGCYVPTLAEMASLYYRLHTESLPDGLILPDGEYLTSSESSETTYYKINMSNGETTGSVSKRYSMLKLRLFYLF